MRNAAKGAPIAGPTFVPAMTTPMARPRCSSRQFIRIHRMLTGVRRASLTPSNKRSAINCDGEAAMAVDAVITPHDATAMVKRRFTP